MRIYRYEVPVDGEWHTWTLQGEPLMVGCRKPEVVEFWADYVDDVAPVLADFMVVGTGDPWPDEANEYVGTAIAPGGDLVWHLIRKTEAS